MRSGWAAHGGRSKKVAERRHFAKHLQAVPGAYFERSGVSPAEWKALAGAMVGRVVLPGMPDYDDDRKSNPRFDEHPKGIVYCAVPNDVVLALALARDHRGLQVTCRSGGHSTAGFSVNNGMVIDLSLMAYASVDKRARTVTTGAGTSFQMLDSVLNTYGLHVPSGGCPDVCVGGYMQGGGYGFTTRQFGINCDRVRAFNMVLPDGRLVTADAHDHAPLYWAVRGGTGNQFGVLTSVTYELNELKYMSACVMMWALSKNAGPRILNELQTSYMRSGAPRQLGYQVMITNPTPDVPNSEPVVILMCMYPGKAEQKLRALLEPLQKIAAPIKPPKFTIGTYDALNATFVDDVLPGPGTPGTLELKRCGYIQTPLGVEGWSKICEYMLATKANPYNMAYLEVYGGAVDDLAPLDNAFIHRHVDCNFVIDSFYNPAWSKTYPESQTQEQAQTWMDGLWATVAAFTNGHVYQNYPSPDDPNYRWQYWGDAFPSLLRVKRLYDPTNLFSYGQSISPYPADAEIQRSSAAPRFDELGVIIQ